jgi:hypothetical protein
LCRKARAREHRRRPRLWPTPSAKSKQSRLLKIGAAVLRNTRRVRVMLASHHPLRELFACAAVRLAVLGR